MSKRKLTAGITSVSLPIFVRDSSSTTGAGLGSLTHASSGLVGEYRRQGESSWTAISLVAGTLGTYTSGGWVANGSLTGRYEVGIPNAALAAGARFVEICFRGATNMVPVLIEIELDAVNYQDSAAFGLSNFATIIAAIGVVDDYVDELESRLPAALSVPTGPPGATPSIAEVMAWVYYLLRYKRVQSGSEDKVHNAAGAVIGTASTTDAGGEFTRDAYT